MALLQVVLFLMMCAVALGWVARHFKFPLPDRAGDRGRSARLRAAAAAASVRPAVPARARIAADSLPGRLAHVLHEFKANIRPIGLLAVGLVIATTLAVGATLKLLIPDIPWAAAFVLGAMSRLPTRWRATTILSRSTSAQSGTVLEGRAW